MSTINKYQTYKFYQLFKWIFYGQNGPMPHSYILIIIIIKILFCVYFVYGYFQKNKCLFLWKIRNKQIQQNDSNIYKKTVNTWLLLPGNVLPQVFNEGKFWNPSWNPKVNMQNKKFCKLLYFPSLINAKALFLLLVCVEK